MKVHLNKRHAGDWSFLTTGFVMLFCLVGSVKIYGQQDTIALQGVEVTAKKNDLSQIGKKSETIDSLIKDQFKFSSVGDVLSYNSTVFIKSYGPGGLATSSFRGGNASQTAILWNGFNLQNAMLGQADLALIPSVLFENIEVEYGGSSSLWGSGAVGGSIRLNNKTRFGQGMFVSASLGTGSFGLFNGSTHFSISKQKFISSTKIYLNSADNNFRYKDSLDKENPLKRQKNAGYNFTGIMQEFKFLINSKQILSVNAWLNSNQRRLPGFDPSLESKTYQEDNAIRITGNWNYIKKDFKSIVRTGYFRDGINYSDSLTSVFTKSKTQTLMAENENYVSWHKNQQLNFGVNLSSSSAVSNNYESTKTISKASLLAGNKFLFLNGKLITYVSVRVDYFSVGALPVTGNVSAEYKLGKDITTMINAGRVYRQPTLNELYWVPGGNIQLKPEEGYTFEGNIQYKKQVKNLSIELSGAAFSRRIHNWILWVPGTNGNPSPLNIQQVWSRGTETTWKLSYQTQKFKAGISVITGYVLSTTESSKQENDATVGRQLIYTPRYTVNGNVFASYNKVTLVYLHQYQGYRFTASDNATWLSPYHVSSLRLSYVHEVKDSKFIFYFSCNNLFNTNYTILAGRPMPLRNYELGITLQMTNKNK